MRRRDPEASVLTAPPVLPAAPADVCAALEPLLLPERLARIDAVVAERTRAVVPVLESVDDPRNVSAVLRSAEAFGILETHLIEGHQPFLASPRVTQGAERWLELVRHPDPETCVASLRARGFQVYVATMQGEATPEDLRKLAQVAVVFGNEHEGASARLQAVCDGGCSIPMRGLSQSLNVSVAAATVLYTLTRGRTGDLPEHERAALRARYILLSVPRGREVVAEYLKRTGAGER